MGDSGAFLFVSPLEPCLPREPCRPGNKQSFVSTDPLCPAARLRTSTPVLMGNHRQGVHSCPARGRALLASHIHLCFHHCPSKQGQAGKVLQSPLVKPHDHKLKLPLFSRGVLTGTNTNLHPIEQTCLSLMIYCCTYSLTNQASTLTGSHHEYMGI